MVLQIDFVVNIPLARNKVKLHKADERLQDTILS